MQKPMSLKEVACATVLAFSLSVFSGCLAVVGGAGAELGYVGAQSDRTAAETLTDQRITSSIKTALLADSVAPGLDINVDTFRGDVTLKGVLETSRQIDRAVSIAHSVEGVRSVDSKLYLQ